LPDTASTPSEAGYDSEGQVGGNGVQVGLEWGAGTHQGCVRDVNQDATLAGPWLFAVADGMGGHAAGEVASSLTVAALAEATRHHIASTAEVLAAIELANQRILDTMTERPETRGMGTTLAAVAICLEPDGREHVLVANIGDARVYRYRAGELQQLSTDHSFVQELVDSGRLSPRDATTHRRRHEITRALGMEPEIEVAATQHEVVLHDRYLVCSDGLTEALEVAALRAGCGTERPAPEAARELIDAAVAAGARDNVSAVVVDVTALPVAAFRDSRDASDTTVQMRQHRGRT
jgi:PPM family protein phosphatase